MFPLAHSPFVQAAILDILNDAIEKSMESGSEGKHFPLCRCIVALF